MRIELDFLMSKKSLEKFLNFMQKMKLISTFWIQSSTLTKLATDTWVMEGNHGAVA